MTKSTTEKLRRVMEMREARLNGTESIVNPDGHPEPTLPDGEGLLNYLRELSRSNHELFPQAVGLVRYYLGAPAGKEGGAGGRGKERRG